jgi:peptidoglycan/LPS O-acetylase OafA/YrhL
VPARRLDYIDGIRALAALFVVLNHAWALTAWNPVTDQPRAGVWGFTYPLMFGHFAVSVFIVVSGFCLMLPLAGGPGAVRQETNRRFFAAFFKRRARRILAPYYFALAFSLFLGLTLLASPTGTTWDASVPVTLRGVLAHLLLLQNFATSAQINPALWSIATEWQIYFLFPLLVLGFKRSAVKSTVAASVGAIVALLATAALAPGRVGAIAPQYIALFAFGMLGATVCFGPRERLRRLPWRLVSVGAWVAFAGLVVVFGCQAVLTKNIFVDLLIGLAAATTLVACAPTVNAHSRLRALLSSRPLVFVGGFAYSIYLIHTPLLQVEWQYGLRPYDLTQSWTIALLLGVGAPLLLVPCYLFHLACERPFYRKDGLGWPSRLATLARRDVPVPVPTEV